MADLCPKILVIILNIRYLNIPIKSRDWQSIVKHTPTIYFLQEKCFKYGRNRLKMKGWKSSILEILIIQWKEEMTKLTSNKIDFGLSRWC